MEYEKIDSTHYCLTISFPAVHWDYEKLVDSHGHSHVVKTNMKEFDVNIEKDIYNGVLEMEHTIDSLGREIVVDRRYNKQDLRFTKFEIINVDTFNMLHIDELSNIKLYVPYHYEGYDIKEVACRINNTPSLYKDFLEYLIWQDEDKKKIFEEYGVNICNPKYDKICYARNIKELITDKDKQSIMSRRSSYSWEWRNSYNLTFDFEKFLLYFYNNEELKEWLFFYRKRKCSDYSLEDMMFECKTPTEYAAYLLEKRAKLYPHIKYVY